MASSKSLSSAFEKIGRHHFECGICTDRFQDPKILDCLHSFCLLCLQNYISKSCQSSSKIACPVCRSQTQLPQSGVGGLRTNFHLVSLMEEFAVQEKLVCSHGKKLVCEICEEEKEATHRCLDCAQNMCSSCGARHLRYAMASNHTVSTLDEIREGKLQPSKKLIQNPKCPNHKDESMRFFCTTCNVLICRDCTVVSHPKPDHVHIEIIQAVKKFKQSLTELCSPLEGELKQIKDILANVSKIQLGLSASVDRITGEVRHKAGALRQEITKQENAIIEEINTIKKERKQKMNEIEKTLHVLEERIQHSLETTKDLASTAVGSDILSLYSSASKLKDLKLLSGQNTSKVDSRLPYLRFKQGQGVGDINLGELVTAGGKWELRREIGKKGSSPGEFSWARDVAVRQRDEIAVADNLNQRVQFFGVDGNIKSQILLRECPSGIAVSQPGNRLVAVRGTAPKVQVFNQDNSLAFEFPTVAVGELGKTAVNLESVVVKQNGNILVGDVGRKVLTEHSPTNGALLRTIQLGIEPDFLAASSNDNLVISSGGEIVHVTDCDGATLFTIKPTIEGQPVKSCRGVYSDSESCIYITVSNELGTGHIHLYDAQGGFLTCIAQGLYYPQGITMTPEGQLVVADDNSVKIY